MQYPGNPALAPEVQQRILGTYQQTLDLAARGSRQEALLGCDFILRMDPAFRPARELMARVNASPAGSAVSVADLVPGAGETVMMPALGAQAAPPGPRPPGPVAAAPPPAVPPPAPPPRANLAPPISHPPAATTPAPAAEGDALEAALADLLAKRELKRLVQVAEENRPAVVASPAMRKVVETAYAFLEAEPYVKNFLDSARAALGLGDFDECDRLLEKARSLDSAHPGVAELAAERLQYEAPDDPWAGMPPELARGFARQGLTGDPLAGHDIDPGLVSNYESLADFEQMSSSAPPSMAGMPSAGGGDGRIAELLAQGQGAFDRGDYQAAIDAWSRIFLIDIDHEEAARRIEQARRLKAEGERRVEEVFHEGVAAFEAGDRANAQRLFERVLALQPGYYAAREYLEQMGAPAAGSDAGDFPPLADLGADGLPALDDGTLQEEILVPPPPPAGRPVARPAVIRKPATAAHAGRAAAPANRGRPNSRFLLVGGGALALLLLVGAFAWINKGSLFPNSKPTPADRKSTTDSVDRARKLHDEGKVEVAIRQLRLIKPENPRYAEAQELLATWEAEAKPQEAATGPTSSALLARFERDVAKGKEAFGANENLLADAYFRRAARVAPLAADVAPMAASAAARLEPLAREIGLFRQGEWTSVLPTLWRLREADPGNKDVNKLIVDSYYNLAVRDLQGGDVRGAVDKLDQALELKPGDEVLKRNRSFAVAYSRRPKDLLYRIYVSHLPIL